MYRERERGMYSLEAQGIFHCTPLIDSSRKNSILMQWKNDPALRRPVLRRRMNGRAGGRDRSLVCNGKTTPVVSLKDTMGTMGFLISEISKLIFPRVRADGRADGRTGGRGANCLSQKAANVSSAIPR